MPTPEQVWAGMRPVVEGWYESKRDKKGNVNTNVMTVGLVLADHMADGVPMAPSSYRAASQVKGLSGERIRKVLAAHRETRDFRSEGGRTSRGSVVLAGELAPLISQAALSSGYADLSEVDQNAVRQLLQAWFVERTRADYFSRQRLIAHIDPSAPVRVSIARILAAAAKQGGNSAGAVAQHLVGAKLVLRFPDTTIDNHSYTTADDQLGRPGDFCVGDTAIHVTTSPGEPLIRKCQQNAANGFRPIVLVPADRVAGGQQIAETMGLASQVAVQSVEDFVGTNVEETGNFRNADIRASLRALLEIYNKRVADVESDPALQIAIPDNL